MRTREVSAALVFCLAVFSTLSPGRVQCDEEGGFLNAKEVVARFVAQQAAKNYENTCSLVNTCQKQQNCSRRECSLPIVHRASYKCVYIHNNTYCRNRTGSACNSVLVDSTASIVRLPPLNFDDQSDSPLGSTICAQRALDPVFNQAATTNLTFAANHNQSFFYNLYFGSVDGAFRYFPTRETPPDLCGKYEPRIRPWYTGAVSVLKDVVVILDTGSAMSNDLPFITSSGETYVSSWDIAMNMIATLAQTLTAGDQFTVLGVNESGSPNSTISPLRVPPAGLDISMAANFVQSIYNNSEFSEANNNYGQSPTNFTAGFTAANATFSDSADSIMIFVLITDSYGNSPSPGDLRAALSLQRPGSRLFVYDLSTTLDGSGTSPWNELACYWGNNSKLYTAFRDTARTNPLLALNSYFNFLARARLSANGNDSVFWSRPYNDAGSLGQVITVSYPAMSPDGLQLVGVAGVDIQIGGLDSDLQISIDDTLSSPNSYKSTSIAQNPTRDDDITCSTGYVNVCSTPDGFQPLCTTNRSATRKEFRSFTCCPACSGGNHKDHWWVVSLGVLGGLFVALLLLGSGGSFAWWARKRKRVERTEADKKVYSYEMLRAATNDFDIRNSIGKGGCGVVYKARVKNEMVAVKHLTQAADHAEEFQAELKVLGFTSHPNLVELKGTCFRPTECFLIYELVEGGDLHTWLWPERKANGDGKQRFLTWSQRRKIARGVASGLNYLHEGLPNGKVYHLDIKPRNILLEKDFNPKLGDFGISKLYEPGFTYRVDSVVGGTYGYMSPEVLQGHFKPNTKVDVYSYGVVLLQLMTGRRADDPLCQPYLVQWARDQVEAGNVEAMVDEVLKETVQRGSEEALMQNCRAMIKVALDCTAESAVRRPEMSPVLSIIDGLQSVADIEALPSGTGAFDIRAAYRDRSLDTVDWIQNKQKAERALLTSPPDLEKSSTVPISEPGTDGNGSRRTRRRPDTSSSFRSPNAPLSARKHENFFQKSGSSVGDFDELTNVTGSSIGSPYGTAKDFLHPDEREAPWK